MALVAIGLIYEGVGYPWQIVFERMGLSKHEEVLADPEAEMGEWATFEEIEALEVPKEDEPAELPGTGEMAAPAIPENMLKIGYLKIPKLGISENVLEGAGNQIHYGIGHMSATSLPGQGGNCVLAGHRNRLTMHPFKHLNMLKSSDKVIFETRTDRYVYEVYETFVVGPNELWITGKVEGEDEVLTLLTCTPVLTLTDRLIVRCRLVEAISLAPDIKEHEEDPDGLSIDQKADEPSEPEPSEPEPSEPEPSEPEPSEPEPSKPEPSEPELSEPEPSEPEPSEPEPKEANEDVGLEEDGGESQDGQ